MNEIKVCACRPPLLDSVKADYLEMVRDILDSGRLTGGEYKRKAERKLAEIHEKKYCLLVSSATGAMDLILAYYARIHGKRKAYLQALGFSSVYGMLKRNGYSVVPVDIEAGFPFMSPKDLGSVVKEDDYDALIVPTAHFGCVYYDLEGEIEAMFDLPMVIDAAPCAGVMTSKSDFVVSFHASKIIGCGEGGALLTDDKELYEWCRYAAGCGAIGRRHHLPPFKYSIGELDCAMIYAQLRHLGEIIGLKEMVFEWYKDAIYSYGLDGYVELFDTHLPTNYVYVVVLVSSEIRDKLRLMLHEDYGVEMWGTPAQLLVDQPIWEDEVRDVPNSRRFSESHLLLPTHVFMNREDVRYVVKSLKACFERLGVEKYKGSDRELWREWR